MVIYFEYNCIYLSTKREHATYLRIENQERKRCSKKRKWGTGLRVKGSTSTLGSIEPELMWSAWLTWHTAPSICPEYFKCREKTVLICIMHQDRTYCLVLHCFHRTNWLQPMFVQKCLSEEKLWKWRQMVFFLEGKYFPSVFLIHAKTSGDSDFIREHVRDCCTPVVCQKMTKTKCPLKLSLIHE